MRLMMESMTNADLFLNWCLKRILSSKFIGMVFIIEDIFRILIGASFWPPAGRGGGGGGGADKE
jgi:hypothetical protein